MAKTLVKGKESRYCYFCVNKGVNTDYKNTTVLRKYVSSFGKIVARKRSGLCSKHQRGISEEIKRARIMALLPFTQR